MAVYTGAPFTLSTRSPVSLRLIFGADFPPFEGRSLRTCPVRFVVFAFVVFILSTFNTFLIGVLQNSFYVNEL
jgi:hypothetical protein